MLLSHRILSTGLAWILTIMLSSTHVESTERNMVSISLYVQLREIGTLQRLTKFKQGAKLALSSFTSQYIHFNASIALKLSHSCTNTSLQYVGSNSMWLADNRTRMSLWCLLFTKLISMKRDKVRLPKVCLLLCCASGTMSNTSLVLHHHLLAHGSTTKIVLARKDQNSHNA